MCLSLEFFSIQHCFSFNLEIFQLAKRTESQQYVTSHGIKNYRKQHVFFPSKKFVIFVKIV